MLQKTTKKTHHSLHQEPINAKLKIFLMVLVNSRVEDGHKIIIKKFGWTQGDNTKTTIPRYDFMFFHVFKMAVAIVFLCENAVEAI